MKTLIKSENLSEVFTPEGIKKLSKGQLLRFNYENSITEFIITRLNKKTGIVIGREVHTNSPDDVVINNVEGDAETFNEYRETKEAIIDIEEVNG